MISMAHFPKQSGGATPTEIWGHPTRDLSQDSANVIRDAVLADATKIAGARVANMLVDEAPARGTLVADGLEQIVVEKDYTAAPKVCRIEGSIDLTNMAGADQVTVRQYKQIEAAGTYIKYAQETYIVADVSAIPLLKVATDWASYKVKVTLQQIAGVNRNYDHEFFTKAQAQ